MAAPGVVPTFDELEDGHAGLGLGAEPGAVNQFTLQGSEEALAHGVGVSGQLHTIRPIRRNVFESPIHFIRITANSSRLSLGDVTGPRIGFISTMTDNG